MPHGSRNTRVGALGGAGVPYFECPNGYGGLLRPNLVKVGDYPEIDEFADSDPDEI
jgi:hypothetical protein